MFNTTINVRKPIPKVRIKPYILKALIKSAPKVKGDVKRSFGTPSQVNVRSGKLKRSINTNVKYRNNKHTLSIFSDSKYAAMHEFGGTITAKGSSGYLVFKIGSHFIKTKQVTIPPRPFLSTGLRRNMDSIKHIILSEILKGE